MAGVEEAADPLIGTKLGPCRVERKVGAGGMGSVYLAHHGPSDEDVAVKVLAPALAMDEEYVARFLREGEQAKKIDHPNVVRVWEAGKHDGVYYIVMEYVRGKALDEILREERRLTFQKATRIIRDIARGLEAAQNRNVIHRDIKPANILVDFKGNPKLTDFGLAKQAGSNKGLTMAGMFMGTPEYVSPEQAEGKPVDFRTDIYSLGVTYYQLLTGKFPFTGQTDVEMAMKRLKADPRPIKDAYPQVDEKAVPIVEKMLRREVSERYQNAKDLLKDLNPLAQGQRKESVGPAVPRTATVIGLLPREVQRRVAAPFVWMSLLPAILLFLAAGALAPGHEGFLRSALSVLTSPLSLAAAGLGVFALVGALFLLRRELKTSGELGPVIGMVAAAAVLATCGTAALGRSTADGPVGALMAAGAALGMMLIQPANLMLMAIALTVIAAASCFEKDEDSPVPHLQRAVMAVAVALWYAFATGSQVLAPFRGLGDALGAGVGLLAGGIVGAGLGIACVSSRSATTSVRGFGVFALAVAAALLLLFGAAGASASLAFPPRWGEAVGGRLKDAWDALPRSGALAILGAGLAMGSIYRLRRGLARTQAFYKKKK